MSNETEKKKWAVSRADELFEIIFEKSAQSRLGGGHSVMRFSKTNIQSKIRKELSSRLELISWVKFCHIWEPDSCDIVSFEVNEKGLLVLKFCDFSRMYVNNELTDWCATYDEVKDRWKITKVLQ